MMKQLPLRRATAADADDVRVVTRSAYAKWVPLIGREPKPMIANYERAVIDHVIELYELEGELLALIELVPRADHLLIENIAVRPDQQGAGLGDKLLQHAENQARVLRLNEARLYTNAAFASNLAFYAKRGYVEFMRETVAPGAVAVQMRKRIAID
jgi:N-acetylglutamate synthase-like GNAT family acetyltransferase